VVRAQVPITEHDMELVDAIRTPGTYEHEAMARLRPGLDEQSSTAAVLAAILHVGASAVTEAALGEGYAAYAASLTDEDAAYHTASRQRRNRRLADA
jgi:hypothetical protein